MGLRKIPWFSSGQMPRRINKIQFLYLVASGRKDSVYKIGISDDPQRRLEEIKAQYDVPNAHILETMDVSTRRDVVAMESALHKRFRKKQATHYRGREWFKLSRNDIEDLESLYQEKSNGFAQAVAYFGMVKRKAEIQAKALEQEMKRQEKIKHNRTYGRTYDTRPAGILKEYNDLSRTITDGHLGQRFEVETRIHPAQEMLNEASSLFSKNIQTALPMIGLVSCIVGTFAGTTGAYLVNNPEESGFFGVVGGIGGFVVGRGKRERLASERHKELTTRAKEIALEQYDETQLSSQLVAMKDSVERRYYAIKSYTETSWQLRNIEPRLPNVRLPKLDKVKADSQHKISLPLSTLAKVSLATLTGTFVLNSMLSQTSKERTMQQMNHLARSPEVVRIVTSI